MNLIHKLILTIFFVITILTTLLYFILKPSKSELLCKIPWCVDSIHYKNKLLRPKTLNTMVMVYVNGNIPCYENAEFRKNGEVSLPGINTRLIEGRWNLGDDERLELKVDTLNSIFQGIYNIDVSYNNLLLESQKTVIYAHRDRTPMPKLF